MMARFHGYIDKRAIRVRTVFSSAPHSVSEKTFLLDPNNDRQKAAGPASALLRSIRRRCFPATSTQQKHWRSAPSETFVRLATELTKHT
jgi:hypothetical protein